MNENQAGVKKDESAPERQTADVKEDKPAAKTQSEYRRLTDELIRRAGGGKGAISDIKKHLSGYAKDCREHKEKRTPGLGKDGFVFACRHCSTGSRYKFIKVKTEILIEVKQAIMKQNPSILSFFVPSTPGRATSTTQNTPLTPLKRKL